MPSPTKSSVRRRSRMMLVSTRNKHKKTTTRGILLFVFQSPVMLILVILSLMGFVFHHLASTAPTGIHSTSTPIISVNNNNNVIGGGDEHDRLYKSNIHNTNHSFPRLTLDHFEHHSNLPESFEFLKDALLLTNQEGEYNNNNNKSNSKNPLESDVVDLSYCDLSRVDWTNFTMWCRNAYESSFETLKQKYSKQQQQQQQHVEVVDWQRAQEEMILQMLEIYTNYKGFCDYSQFRPSIPQRSFDQNNRDGTNNRMARTALHQLSKQKKESENSHNILHQKGPLQSSSSSSSSPKYARLAIVIVAYKDANHLSKLIEAIHMPQHYIIIHLERQTPPDYEFSVRTIASTYSNVVVVKFGTIIYKTDSISHVNLQIMRWITFDLQVPYDYMLTLGGAVYPLVSAQELARTLYESQRHVFLGELTHAGIFVDSSQTAYLRPIRLRLTVDNTPKLTSPKMKVSALEQGMGYPLLDGPMYRNLTQFMMYKSNSGNQAIYSHDTVSKLVTSPQAMQIFALSKYGCCCCIEERNWIAAMVILGLKDEALNQHASMFQAWDFKGMSNGILHTNSSTTFRIEDASGWIERDGTLDVSGAEIMSYLRQAKKEGLLFARKFSSDHEGSMSLLKDIRTELHQQQNF